MILVLEDRLVDARDLVCPLPVIKLENEFKDLPEGQTVKLLATDRRSVQDVPGWADDTDNELVDQSEENGVYTFVLKKLPQYY